MASFETPNNENSHPSNATIRHVLPEQNRPRRNGHLIPGINCHIRVDYAFGAREDIRLDRCQPKILFRLVTMLRRSYIYQHPTRHVLRADWGFGQILYLLDTHAGIRMSAVYVGADSGLPSFCHRWFLVSRWSTSRPDPLTRLCALLPRVRFLPLATA